MDNIEKALKEVNEAIKSLEKPLNTISSLKKDMKSFRAYYAEIRETDKQIRANTKGFRRVLLWFKSISKRITVASKYIDKTSLKLIELENSIGEAVDEVKDVLEIIKKLKD